MTTMSDYIFGRNSRHELAGLYPWLQLILIKTLERHDLGILQGGRTDDEQWAVFRDGFSTLHPPSGKHLAREDPFDYFVGLWSFAADVVPYINGRRLATRGEQFTYVRRAQFAYFLGILKEVADNVLAGTEWEIRLGINWDQDAEILSDQDFDDYFHVEIVRK